MIPIYFRERPYPHDPWFVTQDYDGKPLTQPKIPVQTYQYAFHTIQSGEGIGQLAQIFFHSQ